MKAKQKKIELLEIRFISMGFSSQQSSLYSRTIGLLNTDTENNNVRNILFI